MAIRPIMLTSIALWTKVKISVLNLQYSFFALSANLHCAVYFLFSQKRQFAAPLKEVNFYEINLWIRRFGIREDMSRTSS